MTQVSYAQRETRHPTPRKVERDLTASLSEIQIAEKQVQKANRDAMRARVINWARWKRLDDREIDKITGQITRNNLAQETQSSPVRHLIDDTDASTLDKSITGLPVLLYLTIDYKFLQQLKKENIAKLLKCSQRTVDNRINDALDLLLA